jgi:hypothetical protein
MEHVMRRPSKHMLTPAERAEYAIWSRRVLAIWAVVVATVIALPVIQRAVSTNAEAYAAERPHDAACAYWDDAARDSLASLVRGKHDADLRLVGDAVFRMRRARRNCHMGWANLACLDYYAVIHGEASRPDRWPPSSLQCAPAEEATRAVVRAEQVVR